MQYKLLTLLICLLVGSTRSLEGQDTEFSQFYHAPVYLNPALIGFSEAPRITLNFRDQLPGFGHAFVTSAVAYDQHFHDLNSSLGLNLVADIAGNLLNTYQINGVYAYQLPLTGDLYVKVGFQAGAMYQTINVANIVYMDEIDPNSITGNETFPTNELDVETSTITKLDLGGGFVIYDNDFFAGLSFKHLTQPEFSFTGNRDVNNSLPIRSSFHIGKTFYLNSPFLSKDQSYITPTLLLTNQGDFNQINVGGYFGHGPLFGGLWLRHTVQNVDALIGTLGVKKGIFRFGYSYDFDLGKVQTAAGAHELSLTFDVGQQEHYKRKSRQRTEQSCPGMFQ